MPSNDCVWLNDQISYRCSRGRYIRWGGELLRQTGRVANRKYLPKLIDAIPTRIHHDKRPGDVLKVIGDPLDDVADGLLSLLRNDGGASAN